MAGKRYSSCGSVPIPYCWGDRLLIGLLQLPGLHIDCDFPQTLLPASLSSAHQRLNVGLQLCGFGTCIPSLRPRDHLPPRTPASNSFPRAMGKVWSFFSCCFEADAGVLVLVPRRLRLAVSTGIRIPDALEFGGNLLVQLK